MSSPAIPPVTTLPASTGRRCVLHRYHSPEVVSFDVHHVIPTYMGGLDVSANRIVVCPTGHRNLHVLIGALLAGRAVAVRDWGHTTWDFAHRAFADNGR